MPLFNKIKIRCFGIALSKKHELIEIKTGLRLPISDLPESGYTERRFGVSKVNKNSKGGISALALFLINHELSESMDVLQGDENSPARTLYHILSHKEYKRCSWFNGLLGFDSSSNAQERIDLLKTYFTWSKCTKTNVYKVGATELFPKTFIYYSEDQHKNSSINLTAMGEIDFDYPFSSSHLDRDTSLIAASMIYETAIASKIGWECSNNNNNHNLAPLAGSDRPQDRSDDLETIDNNIPTCSKDSLIKLLAAAKNLFDISEGFQSVHIDKRKLEVVISVQGGTQTTNLKFFASSRKCVFRR